jgi:hypothetical protein
MIRELRQARFVMSTSNLLMRRQARAEEGLSGVFAPDLVFIAGGAGRAPLPDDLEEGSVSSSPPRMIVLRRPR